jgi:hypothetical protein
MGRKEILTQEEKELAEVWGMAEDMNHFGTGQFSDEK